MAAVEASDPAERKQFVSRLSCDGESDMKRYYPVFKAYKKYRALLEKVNEKTVDEDTTSPSLSESSDKVTSSSESSTSRENDKSDKHDSSGSTLSDEESLNSSLSKENFSSTLNPQRIQSPCSVSGYTSTLSDSPSHKSARYFSISRYSRSKNVHNPCRGKSEVIPGNCSFRFNDDIADILTRWFLEHKDNPYPSQDEKAALAEKAGLSYNQVSYWFTNKRKRHWTPVYKNRIRSPRDIFEFNLLGIHVDPNDSTLPPPVEEEYKKLDVPTKKQGLMKYTAARKTRLALSSQAKRHSLRKSKKRRVTKISYTSDSEDDSVYSEFEFAKAESRLKRNRHSSKPLQVSSKKLRVDLVDDVEMDSLNESSSAVGYELKKKQWYRRLSSNSIDNVGDTDAS